jgi:hypothetical protein
LLIAAAAALAPDNNFPQSLTSLWLSSVEELYLTQWVGCDDATDGLEPQNHFLLCW